MQTVALGVALTATWFLAWTGLLSLVCWALIPSVSRRWRLAPPAVRAQRFLIVRVLPASSGLAIALIVAAAFVWYEPRESDEVVRWWLVAGAIAALVFTADAARAARCRWVETANRVGDWLRAGRPHSAAADVLVVEADSLTAVVAGMRPGRVLLGRGFSESLSSGERDAVLAHERAHLAQRDNLKRLLLAGCPDLLRYTARGARVTRKWQEAAEEAADDRVARLGPAAALDLASAIVKAARLAPGVASPPALVSGIAQGGEVAARVSRLIDPPVVRQAAVTGGRRVAVLLAGGIVVGLAASQLAGVLAAVHAVSEFLVNGRF
jgi:Zn-dependent protease with chaperone function